VARFNPRGGNGTLCPDVGIEVKTLPLPLIDSSATIIKLDIEGAEFEILPSQIDEMENVHTWIVELHSKYGDFDSVIDGFIRRGYTVYYLDRSYNNVRCYEPGCLGRGSTTIFCRRLS